MADAKPKGGRPPLPPDQRRTVDVRLYLTPGEADAAYRYAIKHGEPLNAVLRSVLREGLKRLRRA